MYPSLLWSEFTRLNHINSLTMLEQKRAYDNYQQELLQEYMTRQLQLQMQQSAPGGGGGSTAQAPLVITDSDVLAFVSATGITDTTQRSAVNTLVTSLKGYSIWNKLNAIYPFVGGTASTHKWNLKDPRDLDAAYRLSFSGGWTHNSNGITGNGTNAYADTFLSNFTTQVRALGVYTRNTSATGTYIGHAETLNTTDPEGTAAFGEMYINSTSGIMYTHVGIGPIGYSNNTNKSGFYSISSGSASSQVAIYKNGTVNFTENVNPGALSNVDRSLKIGALSEVTSTDGIFDPGSDTITSYTNQNIAFAFIATNNFLSAADMTNAYTAIQAYQTTLSRQV